MDNKILKTKKREFVKALTELIVVVNTNVTRKEARKISESVWEEIKKTKEVR